MEAAPEAASFGRGTNGPTGRSALALHEYVPRAREILLDLKSNVKSILRSQAASDFGFDHAEKDELLGGVVSVVCLGPLGLDRAGLAWVWSISGDLQPENHAKTAGNKVFHLWRALLLAGRTFG